MKHIFLFLLVLLCLNSQAQFFQPYGKNKTANAIYPGALIVTSQVNLYDSLEPSRTFFYKYTKKDDLWKEDINHQIVYKKLNEVLINGVMKGNHSVYQIPYGTLFPYNLYELNQTMTLPEIEESLGKRKEYFENYDDEGNYFTEEREVNYDLSEIKSLQFVEEWSFDEEKFQMNKKVLGVIPIRHLLDYDVEEEIYRRTFLIRYDYNAKPPKNLKQIYRIKYEFPIENENLSFYAEWEFGKYEKYDNPMWTVLAADRLKNLLFKAVINGKIQPYDFETGEPMSLADCRIGLGEREENYMIYNEYEEYTDNIVKIPANMDDVKSFIFVEDWLIDEQSLQIVKTVVGIAPVRYYMPSYENEQIERKVPFVIYFEDYGKKPFIIEKSFDNNHWLVTKNEKYGLVDKTNNNLVIDIAYDSLFFFSEGQDYYVVKQNNMFGTLSANDFKPIVPIIYDRIEMLNWQKEILTVKKNGKIGIVEALTGKIIYPVQYDTVFQDNNIDQYYRTKLGNKYGLIEKESNKEILIPVYEGIITFDNNYLKAWHNNKQCLISISDFKIIPGTEYEEINAWYNGYYIYKENGYYGILNPDFSVQLMAQYDEINPSEEGIIQTKRNNKMELISLKDKRSLIPESFVFDNIYQTVGNIAVLQNGEGCRLYDFNTERLSESEFPCDSLMMYDNSISILSQGCIDKQSLKLTSEQAVENLFKVKWSVPIGFTSYRNNIIEEDGKIYVGSNGKDRNDSADVMDGVYVIDAKTGKKILQIKGTKPGDNDVAGVALASNLLYFGNDNYQFFCYSSDGKKVWEYKTLYDTESCPALSDLNGDGVKDVVFTTQGNGITALNGKTGKVLWKELENEISTYDIGRYMNSPGIYDINNDGTDDIIYNAYSDIRCLNGKDGKLFWNFETSEYQLHTSPTIMVKNNDISIISTARYSNMYVLNREGIAKYMIGLIGYSVSGVVPSPDFKTLITGNTNGGWIDNFSTYSGLSFMANECEGCSYQRKGYSEDTAGYKTQDRQFYRIGTTSSSPVIADLLQNGNNQVLICSEDGIMAIADVSGELKYLLGLPAGVECTPLIKDIDKDGYLEILVADIKGNLTCYATKSKGTVFYGQFRGNNLNTGVVVGN
jgi:hypothetical protein